MPVQIILHPFPAFGLRTLLPATAASGGTRLRCRLVACLVGRRRKLVSGGFDRLLECFVLLEDRGAAGARRVRVRFVGLPLARCVCWGGFLYYRQRLPPNERRKPGMICVVQLLQLRVSQRRAYSQSLYSRERAVDGLEAL